MTILTTDRLVLTPRSVEDFEPQRVLHANPEFLRHITGSAMDAETVWLRLLRDIGHWQVYGFGNWTVRRKADGVFLGSVGIFEARRELEPPFGALEVGWGLDPAHQGQGYALEALNVAMACADDTLKLERTACMISPENVASIRLAHRAGFTDWCSADYHGETITLLQRNRHGAT